MLNNPFGNRNRSRDAGVSLTEVLITIVIISLAVIIALRSETQVWFDFGKSKNLRQAIRIVQDRVEGIKTGIRANAASFPSIGTTDSTVSNGMFLRWTFLRAINNRTPPDTFPDARQLDIVASWVAKGRRDTLKVTTFVSRNY
jgi:prepilin-type N-terminal cleavage/methylation domain-containing protein